MENTWLQSLAPLLSNYIPLRRFLTLICLLSIWKEVIYVFPEALRIKWMCMKNLGWGWTCSYAPTVVIPDWHLIKFKIPRRLVSFLSGPFHGLFSALLNYYANVQRWLGMVCVFAEVLVKLTAATHWLGDAHKLS